MKLDNEHRTATATKELQMRQQQEMQLEALRRRIQCAGRSTAERGQSESRARAEHCAGAGRAPCWRERTGQQLAPGCSPRSKGGRGRVGGLGRPRRWTPPWRRRQPRPTAGRLGCAHDPNPRP